VDNGQLSFASLGLPSQLSPVSLLYRAYRLLCVNSLFTGLISFTPVARGGWTYFIASSYVS
jgi:hypothetical protein